MSAEVQQPVRENPAGPISGPGNVDSVPTTEPTAETTILAEGEAKTSNTGTAEATPDTTNVPKEEKLADGEVLIESKPINEGVLNFKSPGLKYALSRYTFFHLRY